MALVAAIAVSSFLFTADPKGDLDVTSIQMYVLQANGIMPSNVDLLLNRHNTDIREMRGDTQTKNRILLS